MKNAEEIRLIRKAGAIVAACHKEIARRIRPGVTTAEIDAFVEGFMQQHGARPAQKGYRGYRYATCASVNDVFCHGFPTEQPLRAGDMVTIDMVAEKDGWMADSAWTYAVGTPSPEAARLMAGAKQALYAGIAQAAPGRRLGDIGHAVQAAAEQAGLTVVESFVGHGIGRQLHESPQVMHSGRAGTGKRLRSGMVLTIEPILTLGLPYVNVDADGWTARSFDGKWSAQYEHTVAITDQGPVILT
ncbi:methionyl aminopeptidase [Paenibacillus phyllosphaerae]|uniref:Methionine aminopeptidase n=1 Tax=Paenibacillus phyllosphaerae TaxID=274593 RepID=A0A7W5B1J4_9BACL|nr:type I methionyl aminopeptidase [Paenibacillus phyllosphaerae]MBB3112658.1 methionyl aminopeptidase [Paenibacillus phyllosphaerae]